MGQLDVLLNPGRPRFGIENEDVMRRVALAHGAYVVAPIDSNAEIETPTRPRFF